MNLRRGMRNFRTVAGALSSGHTRALVAEAWRLERSLPVWFTRCPLPQSMQRLDGEAAARALPLDTITIVRCADAVALLDCFSPLGACLRRSLVRYVLLRRAGVPVVVHFGAKKEPRGAGGRIAGHAWLTLDGRPFAEDPRDYDGFASVYSYPPANVSVLDSNSTILAQS